MLIVKGFISSGFTLLNISFRPNQIICVDQVDHTAGVGSIERTLAKELGPKNIYSHDSFVSNTYINPRKAYCFSVHVPTEKKGAQPNQHGRPVTWKIGHTKYSISGT